MSDGGYFLDLRGEWRRKKRKMRWRTVSERRRRQHWTDLEHCWMHWWWQQTPDK